MWEYVEGDHCRRETLLRYFGDPAAGAPEGPCCDVCDPDLVPAPVTLARVMPAGSVGDLDSAIVEVVVTARPPVGRTRAVEILRGGRSKVVAQYAYDGLPGYGAFSHLRSEDVLGRVDELLQVGRLQTTGGRFPKLRAA
jgi:ATP-dependent DNA helicase RecQ